MIPIFVIIGIVILGFFLWYYLKVPRPEIPPLTVDKDDPLMIEAIQAAKDSICDFIDFQKQYRDKSQVKIPFQTSNGETEYLWAEVKGIKDNELTVFLLTPPVTHKGKVNRTQTYQLTDIIDWVIFLDNGKAKGGYTMRAMFKIARVKWGYLPDKLLEEEKKYEQ